MPILSGQLYTFLHIILTGSIIGTTLSMTVYSILRSNRDKNCVWLLPAAALFAISAFFSLLCVRDLIMPNAYFTEKMYTSTTTNCSILLLIGICIILAELLALLYGHIMSDYGKDSGQM